MISVICAALLVPAVVAGLYYWFLVVVRFLTRPVRHRSMAPPIHSFAIVVPAHNEEAVLATTLEACAELDYPRDRYQVFVIADNCSDRTAEVAREAGVACQERRDATRRGKGFALAWAFDRIVPRDFDAVVVLDADCRLDRHALRVFDRCLADGQAVVQARYVAANPDASAVSYAVAVGNSLENDLFYSPKDRLGLSVFLRGTGMMFRRDVLQRHPWQAFSVVEDTEYTLRLLRHGIRVRWLDDVCVWSAFPTGGGQLGVQRKRWTAVTSWPGTLRGVRLIGEGLRRGRPTLVDAGLTVLVLSRPLVLCQALGAVLLATGAAWREPGPVSRALLVTALAVLLGHIAYLGLGVGLLGLSRRRLALLARSPWVLARLARIAVLSLAGVAAAGWVRTPRQV